MHCCLCIKDGGSHGWWWFIVTVIFLMVSGGSTPWHLSETNNPFFLKSTKVYHTSYPCIFSPCFFFKFTVITQANVYNIGHIYKYIFRKITFHTTFMVRHKLTTKNAFLNDGVILFFGRGPCSAAEGEHLANALLPYSNGKRCLCSRNCCFLSNDMNRWRRCQCPQLLWKLSTPTLKSMTYVDSSSEETRVRNNRILHL